MEKGYTSYCDSLRNKNAHRLFLVVGQSSRIYLSVTSDAARLLVIVDFCVACSVRRGRSIAAACEQAPLHGHAPCWLRRPAGQFNDVTICVRQLSLVSRLDLQYDLLNLTLKAVIRI